MKKEQRDRLRHLIEKFGWILIGQTRGYNNQLEDYMNHLKDIHLAIMEKIKHTDEKDRKEDLKILKENIEKMLFFCNLIQISLNKQYASSNMKIKSKKQIKSKKI